MTSLLRSGTPLLVALTVASAWAQPAVSASDVLKTLHGGGYVIVFRHGGTYSDQADTDPLNHDNVAKQRQLNDRGRADARGGARARLGGGHSVAGGGRPPPLAPRQTPGIARTHDRARPVQLAHRQRELQVRTAVTHRVHL